MLLDEDAKFLLYSDEQNISSIQYVTVGQGVTDFTENSLQFFTRLPTAVASILSNIGYVVILTESFEATMLTLGIAGAYFTIIFGVLKIYFDYQVPNQYTQNNLVGKINNVNAHGTAIALIGESEKEYKNITKKVDEVNSSIPYLSFSDPMYDAVRDYCIAIGSRYFSYFILNKKDNELNDNESIILDLLLMSLLLNVNSVAVIATHYFPYIKLNVTELNLFQNSYDQCFAKRNNYNLLVRNFEDNEFILKDFSVGVIHEDTPRLILHEALLKLPHNNIYKLEASSGKGKTTFLKAITNNGLYTEGTVIFPISAKNSICYIPQEIFIPVGISLFNILAYSLKSCDITPPTNDIDISDYEEITMHEPLIQKHKITNFSSCLNVIKYLLERAKLMPEFIQEHELMLEDIDWAQRLSGGQKQKIQIIRGILPEPNFLIMDEATSALDELNKQIMYDLIIEHITYKESYMIIYTDHGSSESFATHTLKIVGTSLQGHFQN